MPSKSKPSKAQGRPDPSALNRGQVVVSNRATSAPAAPILDPNGSMPLPSNDDAAAPGQEQHRPSNTIAQGLASLNVQLPDHILAKATADYHGLTPMERFMKETCGVEVHGTRT